MTPPKIGITLGDPGGIGPEVTLKALAAKDTLPPACYILFGSKALIEEESRFLGLNLDISSSRDSESLISVYEIGKPPKRLQKGTPAPENGQLSFLSFQAAVEEARRGRIQALVTAPISKRSWSLAGIKWPGHTDYLCHLFPQALMTFWSEKIKVALFSHHLPLKKALSLVTKNPLLAFFHTLSQHLSSIPPGRYDLLVAGLNPHAGEDGLLGEEEAKEIIPAIRKAQEKGLPVSGPYPPDVVFREALNRPDRIVIALYHDQGLIPFKLEAFDEGVNVTLGLPFIRTSPDHGTAFDLAGLGKANPRSMFQALKLACELSRPL